MMSDEEMLRLYEEKYDTDRVQLAVRIYDDILVPLCRAYATKGEQDNSARQQFIHWFATGSAGSEFRFMGGFGFGGKFWDTPRRWHVGYYIEDRTHTRDDMERSANEALKALHAEVYPNGAAF